MKYLDNLEKLSQELKKNVDTRKKILKNREKDIENAINQINLKYTDEINHNISEKKEIMNKYHQVRDLIEKYSTFNKKTLGQVLAELTSIYKQEEYISYSATIMYYIMYNNSLPLKGLMITPTYDKREEFSDMYIEDHNDRLIALANYYKTTNYYKSYGETIKIYETDEPALLHTNIVYNDDINNPKNVIFIKEFIDYVINYRIENKIDYISLEELEKLKDEFINNHQVEIEEYHKNNNLTLKREKN